MITTKQLQATHVRDEFTSGDPVLDRYLKTQAGQDQKRGFATAFVATHEGSPDILGFYTLSSASVDVGHLPDAMRKKLPRYNKVPAILLGRLAVAQSMQGRGLGGLLLGNAAMRAFNSEIGWALFVVSAKNGAAADFYRHFGFVTFSEDPLNLCISRKTAAKLF